MSEILVSFSDAAEALLRFSFGPGREEAVQVACPWLGGPESPESWVADSGDFTSIRVEVREREGDIEAAAREAYNDLLAQVRGSRRPYLIRIWNYLDAINDGDGDGERYRRFCLGRAVAVDAQFNDPPPAATGIGHAHSTGIVQLVALCSSRPAIALENPRQTPAWRYPRDYGPVSPGFSRGALVGEGQDMRLLASGTASIVGHRSLHEGDVRAQLREALANLDALLGQSVVHGAPTFALKEPAALRVYLRNPADLAAVQEEMAAAGIAPANVIYVHGDICRRELLVELEGVFAPA
ncbi:pteridine-dependent deoxygenase [Xanthomonadaceae bacterium XH05]|nr:pteridine-dependent deoxygenase [Xanthomonadaceae bacterium XH05]